MSKAKSTFASASGKVDFALLNPPYQVMLALRVGGRMASYRRLFHPGGTYFFTVNLEDRSSTTLVDHIAELRAAWTYVQHRHPFQTVAAVVLPDHLHCVWELPSGDHDFPTRWRLLKSHFSRSMAKAGIATSGRRRGERDIWQRRYWEHAIRDQRGFVAHIDYVHNNPVKHGHAGSVVDWPYSTFNHWDPNPHSETNAPDR